MKMKAMTVSTGPGSPLAASNKSWFIIIPVLPIYKLYKHIGYNQNIIKCSLNINNINVEYTIENVKVYKPDNESNGNSVGDSMLSDFLATTGEDFIILNAHALLMNNKAKIVMTAIIFQ
jgi:hypothetical protein